MTSNYYNVLGVDSKATQEDIKRAYRQCARECHPDKCHNDPNANERMKDVNEAFTTLNDPHKRFIYDIGLGKNGGMDGFDWSTIATLVEKMLSSIPKAKTTTIARCVDVDMVVDLDEICRPQPPIKKIAVKVLCIGEGGKKTVERKTLYVSLMNYQDSYTFHGEGDELSPGVFGDICVKLVIKPHECYHLDRILNPYDLHYEQSVSLYEYFYGINEIIQHIDGVSEFHVKYTAGQRVHIIKGLGVSYMDENTNELRRGDLYIMYDLQMPKDLDGMTLARDDVRAVILELSGNNLATNKDAGKQDTF